MNIAVAQSVNLDSLSKALQTNQKNTPQKVDILLRISKELVQRDALQAIQYANVATLIAEGLSYRKGTADGLFTMGLCYEAMDTKPKALEYYQRSAKQYLLLPANISQLAYCYRSIGNIYYSLGDYKDALQYHIEAYQNYEKAKDRKGMAACYSNIGIVQAALGDTESALSYYNKAIKIASEINEQRSIGISYNNIGTAYEKQEKFIISLEYYDKALAIFKEINARENYANTLTGIGDVYGKKGSLDEALKKYLEARDIQLSVNDKESLSHTLTGIGDIFSKMNQPDKAIDYYQQSLTISLKLNVKEPIRNNFHRLSQVYEKSGQNTLAFQNYKSYKVYHDSIYNDSRLSLIAEMQVRYKTDIQEQEIKNQRILNGIINAEKNQQAQDFMLGIRSRDFVIVGTFIFLIVSLAFLYYILKGRNEIRNINVQLQSQNTEINRQNTEIEAQHQTVERTLRKLSDSIQYAKTIQDAILPSVSRMKDVLNEYFLIYKAKETVSGDFFWLSQVEDKVFVALVDCTGHGVSGGFMSMIGNALLSEIINQEKIHSPADILDLLNESVSNLIENRAQHIAIGMEISLCVMEPCENENQMKVTFSGAKRPLLILDRQNNTHERAEIQEIKGGREPIGFAVGGVRHYENTELFLEKGSLLYMCSDGFADQANKANKRFGTPRLKKVLEEFSDRSLVEQQKALEKMLTEFQNGSPQRDDITLIGIRV